jgi:hypothetical protein
MKKVVLLLMVLMMGSALCPQSIDQKEMFIGITIPDTRQHWIYAGNALKTEAEK